jgi:malonate transporter
VFSVFIVTFPFFALVLAGYIAARRRMLPLEAIPGLNGFVLFFALPCMLYRFGASTPIAQLLDPGVFFTWLVCALVIVAFTVAISLNSRIGWNDAAFGALVAAFPNTGFMGVPLLVALLGPRPPGRSSAPSWWTVHHHLAVHCAVAAGRRRRARHGGGGREKRAAGMRVNPLPWSILLGALASCCHLAARAGDQDRGHAGRRRLAGGAVHHRRGAGAPQPGSMRTRARRWPTTCRWR